MLEKGFREYEGSTIVNKKILTDRWEKMTTETLAQVDGQVHYFIYVHQQNSKKIWGMCRVTTDLPRVMFFTTQTETVRLGSVCSCSEQSRTKCDKKEMDISCVLSVI